MSDGPCEELYLDLENLRADVKYLTKKNETLQKGIEQKNETIKICNDALVVLEQKVYDLTQKLDGMV